MRHALLPFQSIVHDLLPRRSHDASRNAVFQAMIAWGAEADARCVTARRPCAGTISACLCHSPLLVEVSSSTLTLRARPRQSVAFDGSTAARWSRQKRLISRILLTRSHIGGGIEFNTDHVARLGRVALLRVQLMSRQRLRSMRTDALQPHVLSMLV